MNSVVDSGANGIESLPDEILEYILSLVSQYRDLDACRKVCRRWSRISKGVWHRLKCNFYKSFLNGNAALLAGPLMNDTVPTISGRYSHSAVYHGSVMYVFGGCTTTGTTFNDLWSLDLTKREWSRPSTTGCYPSPKACSSMCYYNNSLFLFGGWTHPPAYPLHQPLRLFNELHRYDLASKHWDIIHTSPSPPAMAGHSCTVHENIMVVFGGRHKNGSEVFNSSNDIWCLNLDSYCWYLQSTSQPRPVPRYGQSQIELDEEHIIILGGCEGPNLSLDDVWLLSMRGPSWQWQQLRVINSHWCAPQIWCHAACKVDDLIVIFSNSSPVHMIQRLRASDIPADVIARQASQESSRFGNSPRGRSEGLRQRSGAVAAAPHNPSPAAPPTPGCSKSLRNQHIHLAAFRDDVPNPGRNRTRQLECLQRLEERYKKMREEKNKEKRKSTWEPDMDCDNLNMYVLETEGVASATPRVTWRHPSAGRLPHLMLYSIVSGKGELVVFGGIVDYRNGGKESRSLHFVTPPKNVI